MTIHYLTQQTKTMFRHFLLVLFLLGVQAKDDTQMAITCGSAIKIQAQENGYYLSSEEKQMGGGSGQQIITFQNNPSTQDTMWLVRPANHGKEDELEFPEGITSCELAKPIPCNTVIRLTHMSTSRNLHSHEKHSPMSKQQEVTGYGQGDGKGDGGDDWIVRCVAPRAKYWNREEPFHLFHRDTSKFLGTSKTLEFNQKTCGSNCPIMGHLEAFGRGTNDKHTIFTVKQGVHITPS